ncbi:transposase [Erysipelothrix urinaevulpis]|uniref:transposase n=1 Tax=Erysipelothrix urinaevulpis TaxID=2683717 RepID=UPI0013568626|nr:transposase [Erysipelothrix urinaevulpis]
MTQAQVVHELLRLDDDLDKSYHLMQRLRMAIRNRDVTSFNRLIKNDYSDYPKCIITTIKTLRYHKDSINNALTHEYSNGKLEGTNNLIKVIKRIAFGYRSFDNFKSRILLT